MEEYVRKNEMLDSVVKKAKYIFNLCDQEKNGFISKSDLLKLKNDLPLTQDQLEDVFESLDTRAQGFLTYKDFVNGFGNSIGISESSLLRRKDDDDECGDGSDDDDDNELNEDEVDLKSDNFNELILSLSQYAMLKDLGTIRSLWKELSEEGDEQLLQSFEALMGQVVSILKHSQLEHQSLRASVEKQRLHYNEEMYLLQDEVEMRLVEQVSEKQERDKEMQLRQNLLKQLKEKDLQLQELNNNLSLLEAQFAEVKIRRTELNGITMTTSPSANHDQAEDDESSKMRVGDDDDGVKGSNHNRGMRWEISEWMEMERQQLLLYISQLEKKNRNLQDLQDELEEKILSPKRQTSSLPSQDDQVGIQFVNPRHKNDTSPKKMTSNTRHHPHHRDNPHLFRVVFVGDSGVGKTSLMHRACLGEFIPSLPSTVGVDCQMCSKKVGGATVAMQMWDTAGQERFRSFSRQYFRKADAVVAAYDVTKPQSFVSIRAWLHDIQDAVERGTVLMLLGTKVDVLKQRPFPVVEVSMARKLALEYGASLFETSALEGDNVEEAVTYLATVLKERQEKLIETSISMHSLPIKLHPLTRIREQCCGAVNL